MKRRTFLKGVAALALLRNRERVHVVYGSRKTRGYAVVVKNPFLR